MMNDNTPIPNLFVIGAPKCGTTWLYESLRMHPEVFLPDDPKKKEPHFFGADLHKRRDIYLLEKDEYLELFSAVSGESVIGEGSTNYIYSESAPRELYAFNPKAKIICLLRDPVEMVYSAFFQYRLSLNETERDFSAALALEERRIQGKNLPSRLDLREKLFYRRNIHMLPSQLRSYIELFGENQVRVILLEDIRENRETAYREVLEFLDIDTGYPPVSGRVNSSKQFRSKFLVRMLEDHGETLARLQKRFLPRPVGILGRLYRWNVQEKPRPPLNPEIEKSLRKDFMPVVEQLESLLDRDLGSWKRSRTDGQ